MRHNPLSHSEGRGTDARDADFLASEIADSFYFGARHEREHKAIGGAGKHDNVDAFERSLDGGAAVGI